MKLPKDIDDEFFANKIARFKGHNITQEDYNMGYSIMRALKEEFKKIRKTK